MSGGKRQEEKGQVIDKDINIEAEIEGGEMDRKRYK